MAGPLRPNPPRALWPLKFWDVEKKGYKKIIFPLTPPPPLNGPAIKRRTFFYGFLRHNG